MCELVIRQLRGFRQFLIRQCGFPVVATGNPPIPNIPPSLLTLRWQPPISHIPPSLLTPHIPFSATTPHTQYPPFSAYPTTNILNQALRELSHSSQNQIQNPMTNLIVRQNGNQSPTTVLSRYLNLFLLNYMDVTGTLPSAPCKWTTDITSLSGSEPGLPSTTPEATVS